MMIFSQIALIFLIAVEMAVHSIVGPMNWGGPVNFRCAWLFLLVSVLMVSGLVLFSSRDITMCALLLAVYSVVLLVSKVLGEAVASCGLPSP